MTHGSAFTDNVGEHTAGPVPSWERNRFPTIGESHRVTTLLALRRTSDALRRSPVLFVPMLFLVLLQAPQLASRSISPGLANFSALVLSVVSVLVLPFVQGGLVGMADDCLDGGTSLTTFLEEGRRNYVSLLVVSLVFLAVHLVVGVVMVVAGLVALFARYPGGAGDTGALLAVVLALVVVVALAYVLFVFLVQFYAQAIVLDHGGAVDGFKRSAALVRANLASTLGYSACVGLLGALIGGLFVASSLAVTADSATSFGLPGVSPANVLGVALVVVAAETLVGGFVAVFSVAFYRTMRD